MGRATRRSTRVRKPVQDVAVVDKPEDDEQEETYEEGAGDDDGEQEEEELASENVQEQWKALVKEAAEADHRAASNIKTYVSDRPLAQQLEAIGLAAARRVLVLVRKPSLTEEDRSCITTLMEQGLSSKVIEGKAGAKAALSAVKKIYGVGGAGAGAAGAAGVAGAAAGSQYKVGDTVPTRRLEQFLGWAGAGVTHKTMVKYANEVRKILENKEPMRAFGLHNGMSLVDAFGAIRKSQADKDGGRWASAGLLKFMSFVGVEVSGGRGSRASGAERPKDSVQKWVSRHGKYPPLPD
eukprot:COSAG01_NODE_6968_length_3412_cov_229.210383_2_plen_295_part_00